jgi:hypothetical protein
MGGVGGLVNGRRWRFILKRICPFRRRALEALPERWFPGVRTTNTEASCEAFRRGDGGWRVVAFGDIKLAGGIMNYRNERTGYVFRNRPQERRAVLERDLDRFVAVIRPWF